MDLYFSEDEYGQIELLPSCNHQDIQEKLRCPSLSSYHRVELRSLNIPVEKYRKHIGAIIPCVPQIASCYGGFCRSIFAHAEDEMVVVYHEATDDILSAIWLTLDLKTEQAYQLACSVLKQISRLESLILVDWSWELTFYLNDSERLHEYLEARLRAFQGLREII